MGRASWHGLRNSRSSAHLVNQPVSISPLPQILSSSSLRFSRSATTEFPSACGCPSDDSKEEGMGFIMEFAENLILRLMEDPKERDRRFREHLYAVKDRCNKTKEMWSRPLRPYGFWTFERHNSQLFWDPQISQVQGRRDPYDDLLKDEYETPSK